MNPFWYYFYNIVCIPLIYLGFVVGRVFSPKIRSGIIGRRNNFDRLREAMKSLSGGGLRFWIHSSSMGEFEQAKPLIERLKSAFPSCSIVVSFFSPSAFDNINNYDYAHHLCYIPFDSKKNAKIFISLIKPDVAIIVRHDLWPNHLEQLKKNNIRSLLVNCSLRSSFWLRVGPFVQLYRYFDMICTVSSETELYLRDINRNGKRVQFTGDTRYDRVVDRAKESKSITSSLQKLKKGRRVLVAGSTWPEDEDIVLRAVTSLIRSGIKLWLILVPHEPTEERILQIRQKLSNIKLKSSLFSEISKNPNLPSDVLIVDRVGILANLYSLGDLTFVGGGFGPGVHNVLEPAVFGKVVLFGPKHKNSYEAGQLKKFGVGFSVSTSNELYKIVYELLVDSKILSEKGRVAEKIVVNNVGATERIVSIIKEIVKRS